MKYLKMGMCISDVHICMYGLCDEAVLNLYNGFSRCFLEKVKTKPFPLLLNDPDWLFMRA